MGGREVDLGAGGSDGGGYCIKQRGDAGLVFCVCAIIQISHTNLDSAGYSIFIQLIKSVLLPHCGVNLSRETGNSLNNLCCDKSAQRTYLLQRIPTSSTHRLFFEKPFSHPQNWKFRWSERGVLYRSMVGNILKFSVCSPVSKMSWIKADVCRRWRPAVTDCTHSNTINWSGFAVREPLLLCCGPFLRSSTSMRGESSSQHQTDLSGFSVDTQRSARLRTLYSATPTQMDIYVALLSLFFFTKPGE